MKQSRIWLVLITLFGLAAARLSLADGALFPVPPTYGQPSNIDPRLAPAPNAAPDCGPGGAGCLPYLQQWRDAESKRVLSGLAEEISKSQRKLGATCIHATEAFSFQLTDLTRSTWIVRCLAQNSGRLSHMIDFELTVTTQPQGCLSDAKLQEFINQPLSTTRGAAEGLRQGCRFGAAPTPRPPTVTPIDANFIQNTLLQVRPEVGNIIDSKNFQVKIQDGGSSGGLLPTPPAASQRRQIRNPLAPPPDSDGASQAD